MVFQGYYQRLFSVNEFIVLLEESTTRNPEFEYVHFELADMDNSKWKVNLILKTWSASVIWGYASPCKILLFSETKREKR